MPPAFLHGTETIIVKSGTRSIQTVRTSIAHFVGIAPKGGSPSTAVLVLSDADIAAFGSEIPGFTLPQALAAFRANGGGAALVTNVYDAATHNVAVSAEPHTLTGGKLKLTYSPLTALVIVDAANAPVAAVKGTDYEVDDFGNFRAISSMFVEGSVYKFSYSRLDASTVTNAAIIGTETGSTRTGLKAARTAYNLYGFKPKLIVAPGFSSVDAIAKAMIVEANRHRAIALIDAPAGSSVATAIAGRGPAGTINFYTSSNRAFLLFPGVLAYDAYTNAPQVRPLSGYVAGVIARVDNEEGYWVSPSNHEIRGISSASFPVTWDHADNEGVMEATQLNAVGITTIGAGYGTGNLLWGNRSAQFPSDTDVTNFLSVQRTRDVVDESIELGMLPFVDAPITVPQIDSVTESTNAFFRSLEARGAVLPGASCSFNPDDNPDAQLQAGQLVFANNFMPPIPAERITFKSKVDTSQLKALTVKA